MAKKPAIKPRPHTWISGPDEYKHQMYIPWLRTKAQAKFRKEEFNLTFDEYFDLWNQKWDQRGKLADDLCMTRKDTTKPWDKNNCILMTRLEHLRIAHQLSMVSRHKKKYGSQNAN